MATKEAKGWADDGSAAAAAVATATAAAAATVVESPPDQTSNLPRPPEFTDVDEGKK